MFKRLIVLCCLAITPIASVNAQVLYGSVIGNITDSSNAAIAGATVTLVSRETGQAREATTNETGGYTFATLASGSYDLKVIKEGFSSLTQPGVIVTINNITRVDLNLKVGSVTESVLVTAQSAILQTDRSEVRAEVTTKTLENLPVPPGRNYQQVLRTLPGFTPPSNAHSVPSNPSRALTYNVNGSSRSSNNTRIDGASSTNIQLPWVTGYVPGLESIETVNVVTNSFDAEQGLAGGAAVNVQTKSGTNQLHGSAFEYHTNQRLKAKPFFLPAGERNPKLVYNQMGGSFGGPIKKDRLFYFVAYEGTYDRENASRFATVPTAAMRAGDMTASGRPVYDPLTGDAAGAGRTAFPDNIIPASRISPIVNKIVALTPLPNLDGLSNNYYATGPFTFDRHTIDTKVNYNVNSKLTMFGRYGMLHYNDYDPQVFGDALGGPPISALGGNPGNGHGNTYSLTAAATYVLSPSMVADAYFGWTQAQTTSEQARLDEKIGTDILGIPGTNGTGKLKGGWPRFEIDNFTTVGINEDFMPYYKRDPQFQYVANFNWTKGSHNIRFGTDVYRQQMNQTQEQFVGGAFAGGQGGFSFTGGPTTLRGGASANQFNSYAAFLLGLPARMGKQDLVPDEYTVRASLYSMYVQDRWNVTPRLSVSYGLRWEYFPFATRADRGLERYDFATNKMLVCGVGQVPKDCGVNVNKALFAPRFGIAYRPTDSLVIRAGYGLTNDPYVVSEPMRANFPVLIPLNVEGANSFQPAGKLADGIPPIPHPSLENGIIPIPGNIALATAPKDIRRGYVQSWNVTIQKQLPRNLTAQAGYVATRQVRQFGFIDRNAGQVIGGGQSGRPLFAAFGRTAATTEVFTPVGSGQYNALQTSLARRFSNGFQIGANYTFSKAIGVTDNSENNPRVQAMAYYSLNRALTGYDRTHNVQITSIYELPFGRGKSFAHGRLGSAILGGWQVNNILSFMSGTPFSVTASSTSLDMPGSTQRADQIKPTVQIIGGTGRGQSYFDPLAFAPITGARFGNAGYNSLRGPGVANWDVGIFREFAVTERFKVQFRAEAFNGTNTPHFSNPGANVSNLTLNPDGTVRALSGFSEITGTSSIGREGIDERQFRFGLRMAW
jgi:hypothetical protein